MTPFFLFLFSYSETREELQRNLPELTLKASIREKIVCRVIDIVSEKLCGYADTMNQFYDETGSTILPRLNTDIVFEECKGNLSSNFT